ncbi:MAG: 23S rRNA (uracil(1939)-C(5))-methyltransferase RlmD [Erysipelotrichaceae bacterium]|nr:23S rRNA (uracil(1939)-C(5))-methyltransferase RlmD [Erysipelotrichaceae bacterium]
MKNQIVRGKCVDMSVDGQGIAKADGLVIFVKGLIKDEEADIKIIAEKKNYAYGIIDKLITPSIHRSNPDCPIAYKCGGCDYRHIDYDYQLILKKELLINTLKGFNVLNVIGDDNPFYYRNKIQIPVNNHKFGFYRKNSNDIVEFDDCLIESEIANKIISDLKKILVDENLDSYIRHILIKHAKATNQIMVCFIVRKMNLNFDNVVTYLTSEYPDIKSIMLNLNDKDTNVILGTEEKVLYGDSYIIDEFDGIKVKISLKSFYQVNSGQMLKLYNKVKELSGVDKDTRVLDLYCGIGTISLFMSRYAKSVTGVEIVEAAVNNAKENAKLNNINNCDFILADAGKNMDMYLKDKDLVIVDPPRKGITEELINSFIENRIKKIVYVSCNPATLARDLDIMKEYYEIGDIQPVDMFPFTRHCEAVVSLTIK